MNPSALILVVDDEESGRFVKSSILRRAGFDVREAASGLEALTTVAAVPVDAILLDINLPDLSGLEVCRRIKTTPDLRSIQVLHISSTAVTPTDQARGLDEGADAYLTEPVSPEVLVATLRMLLRARTAELAAAAALERERAARDEAERANRSKDDFLAALSHELRTPLNAIMGWIWQLRRTPLDDARRERAFDRVERNTRLQVRLINDLLDISRINTGKLHLEVQPVSLSAVVADAVDVMRDAAADKGVTLSVSTCPTGANGDPARLQQVVGNLIANAIQFTPGGGRITVTLEQEGNRAILRVQDTGVGMEPELLSAAFDLFRQGTGARSGHGGLGVGLALVRQLVEAHGGTVAVSSAGRDTGTTFVVSLPAVELPPGDEPDRAAPHLLAAVHVLLVQDDEEAGEMLTAVLEASGAAVTPVRSADEALERLRTASFDVLVSDIGMPGTDALQLLRTARAQGHELPAVAVTASATTRERERVSEAGYALHIAKPIAPAGFVRTLASLVHKAS